MQPIDYLPEPESVSADGDEVTLNYNEIVGIQDRTFYALDKVFHYGVGDEDALHGATHSGMVPVSQAEYDERAKQFKDYEYSPLAHIYDEQNTTESWDDWIDVELRHNEPELILDMGGTSKFWDDVVELSSKHFGVDAEYIEMVSGGRMFGTITREWDVVFRPDLIALAKDAESDHPAWVEVLDVGE